MKSLLAWFVARTTPSVQRLARAYSLRVEPGFQPTGQWPVILDDPLDLARHRIPASVTFNTRSGSIRVGPDCVFGEEVMLLTGKHLNVQEAAEAGQSLHAVPSSGRDIIIGRGCYIGSRAIVVGPARIGDYAVVGAGAVVTHDVPALAFVAGVPARVINVLSPRAPHAGDGSR
jgi:Hexapeptide repeat of succinyl-transferase